LSHLKLYEMLNTKETKENISSVDRVSQLKAEILKLRGELATKDREIVRLNDIKNQFIRKIAHDLRNPLGVIMSFSEFLTDETKDVLTDIQKDFLERIRNSTNLMLTLIADLIDLTKMNAVNLIDNAEIIDIVSLASGSVKFKKALASEKRIEINFECSDTIVFVYANANKLEQLFNILMMNAIMYSEYGSTIRVHILKGNANVFYRVSVQRFGITPDQQERIFLLNESLKIEKNIPGKETGLGLTIVRHILDEHKGNIYIESDPGIGSTFVVSLPLK
jgi:signal transduction histidine kinase